MCRFVPGQVIALGHFKDLAPLNNRPLPGKLSITPLVTESGLLGSESPLMGQQAAILTTEPGLEIHAATLMAAALGHAIEKGKAAVDLNHYLPWGSAGRAGEPNDGSPRRVSLSGRARLVADRIRPWLRGKSAEWSTSAPSVAVLDSGLDTSLVTLHRDHMLFDYSNDGRLAIDGNEIDPIGHGTRVIKILDEILPESVSLSIGRLPPANDRLTVLTVARAYADLITRTAPTVLNLSLAPRDDLLFCPRCRLPVPAPTLAQTALSSLFRLASTVTFTVMAAGNQRQIPNTRWMDAGLDGLIFAVAEDSGGRRASYSGAPEGPEADLWSYSAFGGDRPGEGASGVFEAEPDSYGTSFAAPFVTCIAVGHWKGISKGPVRPVRRQEVATGWRPPILPILTPDGRPLLVA